MAQAQTQASDPAPLAAALASSAIAAESGAKTKSLAYEPTVAVIVSALEQAIAISGVEPTVAITALTMTQTNMQKAGTLTPAITPAIAAAIAEVLAKVRAAIKVQEGPGATGRTGGPPIGAPGGGGGGGSDYRPA